MELLPLGELENGERGVDNNESHPWRKVSEYLTASICVSERCSRRKTTVSKWRMAGQKAPADSCGAEADEGIESIKQFPSLPKLHSGKKYAFSMSLSRHHYT